MRVWVLIGLLAGALLAVPGDACAGCSTHTISLPDGRFITCVTCCFGTYSQNCNTTCF